MGFNEEFKLGLKLVRGTKFIRKMDEHAPFFRTVIQYLGGLISAYLEKADELARVLSPVFNTTT